MRESALRRVVALSRPVRGRLALSIVLAVAAVAAGIALLATSGYLISRAAEQPPILALTVAIVGVRFFAISRAVTRYLERLCSHDAALRVLVEVRVALLRRLLPLAPARLPRSGDVLSRAVSDVDRLQHVFIRGLAPPVVAAVLVAGSAVAAAAMLPAAGVVLLVALTLTAVVVPTVAVRVTRRANARQSRARGQLSVEVTEAIAGAPELVALGQGHRQGERVREADAALQHLVLRDSLGTATAVALGTAASGLTVVALLLVAVPAVLDGELRSVLLASVVLLAIASFEAVNGLPAAAQGMATTAAAAERLERVAPDTTAPPSSGRELSAPGPLRLAARELALRPAPGAKRVAAGLSFDLEPGERIALLGPSGCGKTTLLRALVGLVPLDGGSVLVDGVSLDRLEPVSLRRRIRLLEQDAYLFATSIAENVRLARPDATDAEVLDALDRVGLGGWVASLPGGVHERLGDDGARASGGQRQRVALARGVLAQADLLLVDEPTSHLDETAAASFLTDLLSLPRELGIVVTTHRMADLARFDRVLLMRGGRIAEDGSPAELERTSAAYARMRERAALVEG